MPQGLSYFWLAGDTLFSLGCGRLFEGTPQQMWSSLSKLVVLPLETRVYCAHEYTQSNAKFAVSIDPNNQALQKRKAEVDDLRSRVGERHGAPGPAAACGSLHWSFVLYAVLVHA